MLTGDALTRRIIGLAIEVHRHLGPGLLESAYEECLSYELTASAIPHERQVPLAVAYEDTRVDLALRADVVVADEVLRELKALERLLPVHEAQVLTYLRMRRFRVGLLINFHSLRLKDGLRRFVA